MTVRRAQVPSVRTSALRAAFLATGVVAAGYLAISLLIVGFTGVVLTRSIDVRLDEALERIASGPRPEQGRPFDSPAMPGRRFGPTLLVWTETADGRILSNVDEAPLPVRPSVVTAPVTVTVGGTEVRVAGASAGASHVVVGQTLEQVGQAQGTVIGAELAIAPFLLLVVFLGAFAVGRRAAAPIEAARRRQMEFTADASHELRTPLSVIEAQTSLALAAERDAAWSRDAFARIDHESRRMRALVEDMLWLARFDAAQGPASAEPVDLALLVAGAADRFLAVAEARGISLTVAADSGAGAVAAPPDWLDRLLGVLLDNACRYAPEGGRVAVGVRAVEGRAELVVDDDGPGIPEAERQRIFDRFHRATETPGGSGLGLAIADAVVRATGGRWRVGDSTWGGASISVSWPRAMRGDLEG